MIDTVTLFNALFGAMAIVVGLYSRRLLTAAKAGFLFGLLHAGMIGLALVQSGTPAIAEPPFLMKPLDILVETVGRAGYANVPYLRLAGYLAAAVIALVVVAMIAYIVSFVFSKFVGLFRPKAATA